MQDGVFPNRMFCTYGLTDNVSRKTETERQPTAILNAHDADHGSMHHEKHKLKCTKWTITCDENIFHADSAEVRIL